ncbi:MAG: LLM class F420-dependent oxidoreductase [Candidatus Binataceae bacterium]
MKLGITIPFDPFHNLHFAELVRTADRCGYTDAWSYESFSSDAFAPLAAAAMLTSRMRLGTAIVPVFTRPPGLIAMAAQTVQQISGGRLVLGLGISTPNIVQEWMGVPFQKPVTLLRETVEVLRAVFRGEKVNYQGRMLRVNGFRMDLPIDGPPPIYIAAQGVKMLRIAGEIGDGLITNFIAPERLPAMLDQTRDAMRAAGKDASNLDVVARILVAVDEDEATARTLFRRALTAYLTVPQYNQFFREIGYAEPAAAAYDAWHKGDRKSALAALPEEMIEDIFVFGSAAQCRKRLDDFARAGITTSALQFNSFAPTPEERRAKILKSIEKIAQG